MVMETGKKCSYMWSITASFVLDTKNAGKEFTGTIDIVLHIEHSCHSYERIYEYCSEK